MVEEQENLDVKQLAGDKLLGKAVPATKGQKAEQEKHLRQTRLIFGLQITI